MNRLRLLVIITVVSTLSAFSTTVMARDYSKIFEKVDPSVVVIHASQSQTLTSTKGRVNNTSGSLGSGVVISAEGHLLTAAHVVHTADDLVVELVDGSKYSARILSSIVMADLALLQIIDPPEDLNVASLGDSDKIKIGAEVFIIGSPYGLEHTLTSGNISHRRLSLDKLMFNQVEFLQTDAAINQGNSGGPMFNNKGEVIGIVSYIQSQSGGSEGLGFAVAINNAKRLLLAEPGLWWGLRFIPLKENALRALNVPEYLQGFLVQNVAKNSLASKFRLNSGTIPIKIEGQELVLGGDIVVEIGGQGLYQTAKGYNRIQKYLTSVKEGELMTITVYRGGKKIILKTNKPYS